MPSSSDGADAAVAAADSAAEARNKPGAGKYAARKSGGQTQFTLHLSDVLRN